MGQTLSNGLYLPDEGERNSYAGLESNWRTLDALILTVDGKAAPNVANTWTAAQTFTAGIAGDLTGNVTGNVTGDLTGTASKAIADEDGTSIKTGYVNVAGNQTVTGDKTWTGDNTYSKPVVIERNTDTGNFLALRNSVAELGSTPASATPVTIAYRDKNNDNLGYMGVYYDTNGSNIFNIYVRNKFTSGAPSTSGTADYAFFGLKLNADKSKEGIIKASFRPYDNNTHSLGSSSYQWSAVYAQTYYYNGTAWGLDKENVWAGNNRFVKNAGLSDISTYSDNTMAFTANANTIFFNTRGSSNYPSYGTFLFAGYMTGTAPDRYGQLKLLRSTDLKGGANDGYKPDSSFNLWRVAPHYSLMDFMEAVRIQNDGTNNYIAPINNATDLGTSTNKWKSLNGINPGALSLPDSTNKINIDTTGWILNDPISYNTISINNSTAIPSDGWIYTIIPDKSDQSAFIYNTSKDYGVTLAGNGSQNRPTGRCAGWLPVFKGDVIRTYLNVTSVDAIRFYPCLGNV